MNAHTRRSTSTIYATIVIKMANAAKTFTPVKSANCCASVKLLLSQSIIFLKQIRKDLTRRSRNRNGVQPSPAAATRGGGRLMNKSSALRAEDVAAPEDGRAPANSSQNVTMLRD